VRNIENDVETECEEPLTQEIYHSFTEFRRKSRQAVLNALEDELHVCEIIFMSNYYSYLYDNFIGNFSKCNFRIQTTRERLTSASFGW